MKIYAKDLYYNSIKTYDNHEYNYDDSTLCLTNYSFSNGRTDLSFAVKGCRVDSPVTCRYFSQQISYNDSIGYFISTNVSSKESAYSCIKFEPKVELTNNPLYYPRIDGVMVTFFVIVMVCFYFPYRIFARAFGRWFKV